MSSAALDATCPRCGRGFECGANAGHCACFGLRLTDAQRAGMAARYPGRCLCLRCLGELADADSAAGEKAGDPSDACSPPSR